MKVSRIQRCCYLWLSHLTLTPITQVLNLEKHSTYAAHSKDFILNRCTWLTNALWSTRTRRYQVHVVDASTAALQGLLYSSGILYNHVWAVPPSEPINARPTQLLCPRTTTIP